MEQCGDGTEREKFPVEYNLADMPNKVSSRYVREETSIHSQTLCFMINKLDTNFLAKPSLTFYLKNDDHMCSNP